MSFHEPISVDVREGNTVRVVCRVVGERSTGMFRTVLETDVCRDLSVLDTATYEWSGEHRAASERMRQLAQASLLHLGEDPELKFIVDADWWGLSPYAYCEDVSTPVGHDTLETTVPASASSISELESLWLERGLIVDRFVPASGVVVKASGALLQGEVEGVGVIMLRIDGDRYVLTIDTKCL